MIMKWRKAHFDAFRLALYITVKRLYVKSAGYGLPVAFIRPFPIQEAVPHT